MEDSKIIRVIKTLNIREFKRFKSYVDSPYFNKNVKLIILMDYIAKFYPLFDADEFNEKAAFTHTFPDEQFKENTIIKLTSKLFKLLTDFFTVEQSLDDNFQIEFNLLKQYSNSNLLNDFDRLSKKINQKRNLKENLKVNDYYNKFLIDREVNKVFSTRKDKGIGDVHFKNASQALDIYYLYTKLVYTCQEINRGNVIKGIDIDKFDKDVVEMIPFTPYKNEPIIDIWYTAYLLLTKEDKILNIKKLKNKLYKNPHIPNPSQLRMLFTFLENATIKIFSNREDMYKELFQMYNFQIERDIFLNDEFFTPGVMKNYITVSLNLSKLKEARFFLERIKSKVIKIHPNDFKFCEVMLLFWEKKYSTALDIINEVNFNNIVMKLNERTMRLKIYYHLEYFDLLYDSLNSFRVFLTNNKEIISDRLLDANRRFSNYLFKIIRNRPISKEELRSLKNTILSDSITIDKRWLLDQVSKE